MERDTRISRYISLVFGKFCKNMAFVTDRDKEIAKLQKQISDKCIDVCKYKCEKYCARSICDFRVSAHSEDRNDWRGDG
jgi:acetolactate synthase small subunit